jgi:hypothetical protein
MRILIGIELRSEQLVAQEALANATAPRRFRV